MTTRNKLWSVSINGNLHNLVDWINDMGWEDEVVHMESNGHISLAVFRFKATYDAARAFKNGTRLLK